MIDLAHASAQLLEQIQGHSQRIILGVAGAPGAGKSTAAQTVLSMSEQAGVSTTVVSMDGWHLAHRVLLDRGQEAIKGAPDTFDAHGFVDAVCRIRQQKAGDPSIWLPEFRREIEDAVAGAIEVRAEHRLVLIEGNYLLLQTEPWAQLRAHFDVAWMLTPNEQTRHERLIDRHTWHGRSPAAARERALGSDELNARRVMRESTTDQILQVNPG